ncbi:MAG: ABC transporter ATP-binding protein [Desulfurococcales archaeon]|nr:ABC transporter ATP-binding protein [Desulfurococcales archaeon]
MAEIVRVRGVSKSFGRIKALRNIDLTITRGRVVGLVGPNGAGKTTLIKIILGILSRDSGYVELNGRDPFKDPEARVGVGVVFERPNLPEAIPVRKLLEQVAGIHGSSRSDVEWAIEVSGLKGFEWRRFNQLSAGLKQRAAIAHALVARPNFVIADEPTSNLDPVERIRILELISRLNRDEGVTFLFSSHVLPEVLRVADELVIINNGSITSRGPPEEVIGGFRHARIRSSNPLELARLLSYMGFEARVEGLNVKVEVDGAPGISRLFKALASMAGEGIVVYGVDLVEPGVEEVLRSAE